MNPDQKGVRTHKKVLVVIGRYSSSIVFLAISQRDSYVFLGGSSFGGPRA